MVELYNENESISLRYISTADLFSFLLVTSIFLLYGAVRPVVEIICVVYLISNYMSVNGIAIKELNYYIIWGLLFIITCGFSIATGLAPQSSAYGTRGVIECYISGLAVCSYVTSNERMIKLLKFIIISSILLFLKIILTVPLSQILDRRLPEDLNANAVGVRFAISLIILVWLRRENILSNYVWLIVAMIVLTGAVLSGSKKALIVSIIGSLALFVLFSDNLFKLVLYLAVSTLAIILSYWLIQNNHTLYQVIGKRLDGLINAVLYGAKNGDASTRERILLIGIAISNWKKRPLFGYGINSFGEVVKYSAYNSRNMYSHCNYTELLFGVGILGISIYYSLHLWATLSNISHIKNNTFFRLTSIILISILFMDIAMVSYGDEFIQFLMAVVCAGIGLYNEKNKNVITDVVSEK